MHIPDGFVDLPTSGGAAALALPTVALATRRAGRQLAEREVPLAGLVVAYLVVAQLLVFPVGLGTGAHLLGTGLALVLVGPWVAYACVTVVLVLQALVFADGGLTALGLNALNNGLVPLLVGWAVLAAARSLPAARAALPAVAGTAAGAGAFAGAVAFCAEYAIGGSGALRTEVVTAGFLAAHAVVAVVEAVLTALLVAALLRTRPDLVLRWRRPGEPAPADIVRPSGEERTVR
jgi:cobalt/nickel transport system permease protein